MTRVPIDREPGPTRRSLLVAGAGAGAVLAAGCAPAGAPATPGATPGGSASPRRAAAGPTPGVMTLFKDPAYNFNGLLALGAAGQQRAGEPGPEDPGGPGE
ncbi:hypothetical protein AB0D15_36750, partial [Streptomyces sp. NPDC048551]